MFEHIDLIEQQFHFGRQTLIIKRVKNLDDMVNRISDADFEQDERLPYWAELWPSAEALSRFLFRNPHLVAGRSVLELGCGLGLTSLSLACQKPKNLLSRKCQKYQKKKNADCATKQKTTSPQSPPVVVCARLIRKANTST